MFKPGVPDKIYHVVYIILDLTMMIRFIMTLILEIDFGMLRILLIQEK